MTNDAQPTILVVDDEEYICRLVARILEGNGYACTQVAGGAEALAAIGSGDYALVISDINMPGMSGLELLATIRQTRPDIAVSMLTAVDSLDTGVQALELGAYGYMIKPFQPNELLINVANALRRRELEKLRDDYEHRLELEVRARTAEIYQREEEITIHLVAASEYRHVETGRHIRRMARYAVALAKVLGWSSEEVDLLRLAAPMHDIGKIGIPDRILLKPGKLTPEEYLVMQEHTTIGAGILAGSDIPLLRLAGEVALCHHERWDGTGYPRALAGDAIPESARIMAIADVYDALITDRVYRPAYPEAEALRIINASQGHFDPRVFACLCELQEEFRLMREQ